ncbi:hypothetical protein HY30_16130 [Hyphomonas chukchiensis]|uniref:Uncharacterized protein n=1 Tax=Hyphomonas chukchiensis TaxID=1280947 RepID=A0A062UP87_9PROT|nr:hypothetical protein HY30_16130 [Hyphomonas chukchiensis]
MAAGTAACLDFNAGESVLKDVGQPTGVYVFKIQGKIGTGT